MTTSNHTTHTISDSALGTTPVSAKQFISFEHIVGGVFTLFIALCIYVWNNHSGDFKELKQDVGVLKKDVNAIRVLIPTLATKAEMDVKFDKVGAKLDALILSVNTMQSTMATKEDINKLATKLAINSYRLDKLESVVEKPR
ncbi:MAG: hypothetical protein ACI8WB_000034 [Phenylobacterium sp.]|jgi:hypothetical protein